MRGDRVELEEQHRGHENRLDIPGEPRESRLDGSRQRIDKEQDQIGCDPEDDCQRQHPVLDEFPDSSHIRHNPAFRPAKIVKPTDLKKFSAFHRPLIVSSWHPSCANPPSCSVWSPTAPAAPVAPATEWYRSTILFRMVSDRWVCRSAYPFSRISMIPGRWVCRSAGQRNIHGESSFIMEVSGHWACQSADSTINYQQVCEKIPSHSQLCGYACKVTVFSTKHVQREWLLVTAELRMS